MILYSATVRGFFDSTIHTSIPPDAKPLATPDDDTPAAARAAEGVARARHQALFAGQAEGKVIVPGPDGVPMLADPPALTNEQLMGNLRARRNMLLAESDGLVVRQRDEVDAGAATSLSADQYKAVLAYRQALRDMPKNTETKDLAAPQWPVKPI